MHIVYLPIEPFEARYSQDWLDWTKEILEDLTSLNNFTYDVLLTEAYDAITEGSFLDVIGTNIFKGKQLQMCFDLIKRLKTKPYSNRLADTVFYLQDGWFPGIESLAYIRNALGLKFKIACCLHAGTWDSEDFISQVGMREWAPSIEFGWLQLYDAIFVATHFHKNLICKFFDNQKQDSEIAKKIHVTGFPIFKPSVTSVTGPLPEKDDVIIFPHRYAPEKRPEVFRKMRKLALGEHFQFIETHQVCANKASYYKELSQAKYAVSFSTQETWGIAMQEAVLLGCIPVVPNRLSYTEMYPSLFKYNGDIGNKPELCAMEKILKLESMDKTILTNTLNELKDSIIISGENALPNQIKIMQSLIMDR